MSPTPQSQRPGMTLVELLVVVGIIGLLAVVVAPLLQNRSSNRQLEAAADLVASHCSAAMAKSIGSAHGAGIWLEQDGVGGQAVSSLAFSRPRVTASGTARVTGPDLAASPPSATVDFDPALIKDIKDMLSTTGASVISFAGIPQDYNLVSDTIIQMPANCTAENASFPGLSTPLRYSLQLPPRRKSSVGASFLAGDACIDLSASTIGVHGYTATGDIVSLSDFQTIAIQFDGVGRPSVAWLQSKSTQSWQKRDLQANMPVALLIGARSRIGLPLTQQITDDDPGPNTQNPDAVWAVIDPRSAVVRTVDNRSATTVAAAQAFVAESLANQVYQR